MPTSAHVLVQGADVWLNVPRIPMEAVGDERHEGRR